MKSELQLMTGNEAAGEGAIRAGCRFYYGYPITPQNELTAYMAKRMLEILDRICSGEGRPGDVERLEDLARKVQTSSLCGLGRTAPNPVLTTLRYFREEYEAHIEGHCPAGVCPALITFRITDRCIGCTICVQHCPVQAIPPSPYEVHVIETDKCIRCGTCRRVCPEDAVIVE